MKARSEVLILQARHLKQKPANVLEYYLKISQICLEGRTPDSLT